MRRRGKENGLDWIGHSESKPHHTDVSLNLGPTNKGALATACVFAANNNVVVSRYRLKALFGLYK